METKTSQLERLIENLVNGNLKDAKQQARRHSLRAIRDEMICAGWSVNRATLGADYLKGADCWQQYCNAK